MTIFEKKRLWSTGTVGGQTKFQMITDQEPTKDEVAQVQIDLGYHPAGYDGPWGIKTIQEGERFTTTWTCAGSCD